jgi:membrane protease YdiL (CAAX protease family)
MKEKSDSKGIILSFILFGLIFIEVLEGHLDILPPIYSSALYYSVCILIPFIFAFLIERRGIKSLGLRVYRLKESVILALILSAIYISGYYLTVRLWFQPSFISLSAPAVLALLCGYFSPGFLEELPFRGYMQTRFQKEYRFYGVILTAILVGLIYVPKYFISRGDVSLPSLVSTLLVIPFSLFVMGYIFWKTNSIISTILIHGTLAFSAGLAFSFFNIGEATLYQIVYSNVPSMLIFYTTQVVVMLMTVWLSNIFFKESK